MRINLTSTFSPLKFNSNLSRHYYQNLQPLKKDTVSFSGPSELMAESMADAPQVQTCKRIHDNAVGAAYYLYAVLNKYMSDFADLKENDTTKNELGIYPRSRKKSSNSATFELRIKSPSSIREKVVSKHAKLHRNEHEKFAKHMYDSLYPYLTNKSDEEKDNIINLIKNQTQDAGSAAKSSAYSNSKWNVPVLIDRFEKIGLVDFSSLEGFEKEIFISNLVDDFSSMDSLMEVNGEYLSPSVKAGVMHYANDVVGARIILNEQGNDAANKVLAALKKAVNDGVLKITSIENNIPAPSKIPQGKTLDDYTYASDVAIKSLEKAAGVETITNESKTGYLAIHINVDLSDAIFENYGGIFNGYKGEIQIIGRDVEQLKAVEDLCYKFKDNKNAANIAYKPFKEHFLKFYQGDVKKAFDDYTYALYLDQRLISPSKRSRAYRSIKSLGFDGKVPEALDFNTLKRIYDGCKSIEKYNQQTEQQEPQAFVTEKKLIHEGNYKTIKSLIDNKLNKI